MKIVFIKSVNQNLSSKIYIIQRLFFEKNHMNIFYYVIKIDNILNICYKSIKLFYQMRENITLI